VVLIHWSKPQLLAEARISWCDADPQKPGADRGCAEWRLR
jgi:hypothetical protein